MRSFAPKIAFAALELAPNITEKFYRRGEWQYRCRDLEQPIFIDNRCPIIIAMAIVTWAFSDLIMP